jgi:hemoglobin-like flavoprotein
MNAEILRTSFEMVDSRDPNFVARFYVRLLTRYPQLRVLFGAGVSPKQHAMLYQALVAILDHLDDAAWLEDALTKYGARHAGYGVTDEMYDWFGECLLATLAELDDSVWTPELAAAWSEAYLAVSDLMKAGAAKRRLDS